MSIENIRESATGERRGTSWARLGPLPAAVTACIAFATIADAQTQTWASQFGTSGTDLLDALATDGAQGVFVGGSTTGSLGGINAGGFDAWFGHVDRAGTPTWIRQLGSLENETCTALARDDSGGVFACGFTAGDLAVPLTGSSASWIARHDAAGNQIWIRQFGESDHIWAAAPDGSGGLFVCGDTWNLTGTSAGAMDAWLAHVDGSGSLIWLRQLGSSGWDGSYAIATDGSGGVFLCGSTDGAIGGPNAGSEDIWLAHYDGAGSQTWIRQLGTAAYDLGLAAASDGAGGVFIGGDTQGSFGAPSPGGRDAWVGRYDGAGNQLWIQQFGTLGGERTTGMTTDGSGGVFVSGYTEGSLGGPSAGGADAWLAQFDAGGARQWTRQLGSNAGEGANAIAWSSSIGIFVAGGTWGDLGAPNAGFADAWVALYDGVFAAHYCTPAPVNSTGVPGAILAAGSSAVAANEMTLIARQLPANSFGFFVNSLTQGFVANPGGSQGNLCLGGAIGRYSGAGEVLNTGSGGSIALQIDLAQTPTPMGFVSISAGQTWNFQAWYRDANPASTSNLTDALSIGFY